MAGKDSNSNWDASTYDHISQVIESWGLEILEYRKWKGDEIVLDAGCGSGTLTKILSDLVPHGRVIGIDIDPAMIKIAKAKLADSDNIQVIQGDISEMQLQDEFDVVFSNAVLHWIPNHRKVFDRFSKILNPDGQLLVQCGGYGNLAKSLDIFDRVRNSPGFCNYFENRYGEQIWANPWYFAKKEDVEILLKDIGFTNIHVFLENKIVNFENKGDYSLYIRTIVLKPYLEYLPEEQQKKRFIESIINEIGVNMPELKWKLHYVRLNIFANKKK